VATSYTGQSGDWRSQDASQTCANNDRAVQRVTDGGGTHAAPWTVASVLVVRPLGRQDRCCITASVLFAPPDDSYACSWHSRRHLPTTVTATRHIQRPPNASSQRCGGTQSLGRHLLNKAKRLISCGISDKELPERCSVPLVSHRRWCVLELRADLLNRSVGCAAGQRCKVDELCAYRMAAQRHGCPVL